MILALKGIGAWLLKNPVVIGLSIALAAALIVIAGKNSDISFYKAQSAERADRIEKLNQRVGIMLANNALLSNAVTKQNQAIDALAQATADSDAKFAASFIKLEQGRAATGAAVAELMKRAAPDDKCAGAYALVKEFAQ